MTNILLVEDDATMIALLKTLLELEGHHVTPWANQNQDVLQLIRDERPDTIIMDVHLRPCQRAGITQVHSKNGFILETMDIDDIREGLQTRKYSGRSRWLSA